MKNILILVLLILTFPIISICQVNGMIETEKGVLHYKTYGNGEPILIINGGPGLDCEGFNPLAELLSDKYMTILYDQRGTGGSKLRQIDSTTVTMDLMAGDIEILRKYLKIDKWIVLGHSFGGFVSEYYASKYPESLKALILSSTGGIDLNVLNYFGDNLAIRLSQTERDSMQYWDNMIKQGDTTRYAKFNKAKYLASAYLYDKSYIPVLAKRLAFGGKPEITELVYKDLFKIKFDCKETLKDFSKPVLIIQGRQDITGDGVAYEAHSILKNSSIVFINKSGHYSWWEQSEIYTTEIEKFVSSLN